MGKTKPKTKGEPWRDLKQLYVTYSESRSGGDVCDYEEGNSGPYLDHDDEFIEIDFKELYRQKPEHYSGDHYDRWEEVDLTPEQEPLLEKDHLYLAVIFYSDGGTFGRTRGYPCFVGVAESRSEAQLLIHMAKDKGIRYKGDRGHGYKPWEGYFAGWEGSDVFRLFVEDKI